MNQVGYGASGPGAGVRVVHTNAHSFSVSDPGANRERVLRNRSAEPESASDGVDWIPELNSTGF